MDSEVRKWRKSKRPHKKSIKCTNFGAICKLLRGNGLNGKYPKHRVILGKISSYLS